MKTHGRRVCKVARLRREALSTVNMEGGGRPC